jgi:hypothetical protein
MSRALFISVDQELGPFSPEPFEFLPRRLSAVLLEEGGDVLFFAPALLVDRLPLGVLRER